MQKTSESYFLNRSTVYINLKPIHENSKISNMFQQREHRKVFLKQEVKKKEKKKITESFDKNKLP